MFHGRIVVFALALLWCLSLTGNGRAGDASDIPIVDCHVHLWDIGRPEGITWISKDSKVLNRSFPPEHHEPLAKTNGVQAVVVVQAVLRATTFWTFRASSRHFRYIRIVPRIDLIFL